MTSAFTFDSFEQTFVLSAQLLTESPGSLRLLGSIKNGPGECCHTNQGLTTDSSYESGAHHG